LFFVNVVVDVSVSFVFHLIKFIIFILDLFNVDDGGYRHVFTLHHVMHMYRFINKYALTKNI